jgi:hypothetical protein
MLFAAYFAIVFCGHLEQLEAAIGGQKAALIPQRLHRFGGERFEIHCNPQILLEDLHSIDATDRGRNRQAQGIAQALFGSNGPVPHEFAADSQAFHAYSGNAATCRLGQHVSFETA